MNKQDYEKMSDSQINMSVAKLAHSEHLTFGECQFFVGLIEVYATNKTILKSVDYCNNPSDMMPLCFECGISIVNIANSESWFAAANVRFETICMSPDGSDNGVSCMDCDHAAYGTRQLRAAAIVYLKMMEK